MSSKVKFIVTLISLVNEFYKYQIKSNMDFTKSLTTLITVGKRQNLSLTVWLEFYKNVIS